MPPASERSSAVDQATFGFDTPDIDHLAAELMRILGIQLFAQSSPMIGPWYSSEDLGAMFWVIQKVLEQGGPEAAQEIASTGADRSYYELVQNNPEPGYTAPEFPGGGHYLLRVRAEAAELQAVERKLHDAGLRFRRLKG